VDHKDIIVDGDNISVPYWQCGQCEVHGEAATPEAAKGAMLAHFRAAHPDHPIVLPEERN
jgi:hypothetical protein